MDVMKFRFFILIGLLFALSFPSLAQKKYDNKTVKLAEDYFFYVWRNDTIGLQNFLKDNKKFPPDYRHKDGYTALQLAAALRYPDVVKILLEKGANPWIKYPVTNRSCVFGSHTTLNAPAKDSVELMEIAILSAEFERDTVMIKYLWERLYNGSGWYDKSGNTLLHIAAFSKAAARYWAKYIGYNFLGFIVKTCNINPNTLNFNGQNALTYYLSQPGNCKDNDYKITYCNSPKGLFFEASRAGINVDAKDNFGKNYLSYLREFNQEGFINAINAEKEYQRVLEIQKKFAAFDHEAMRRKNNEAVRRYADELHNRQSGQNTSGGGCKEKCFVCHGFGSGEERAIKENCPECNGRGSLGYSKSVVGGYNYNYTYLSPNTCWKCNGTGVRILYETLPCGNCNGTGCLDNN